MKISLNGFKGAESLILQEELSSEDLDLDIGIMSFPDALKVKIEAWKSDNDLSVNAHVEGMCQFTCSLCLEEFNNLFEKEFSLHYDIKGLDSVTIDQDVRDEILMEHPIRILCRPDCRGLCPFCGTNLNADKCNCKTEG
ncbi:MAG: YceD family protein [Candidatus Omnitrophota bacterium]